MIERAAVVTQATMVIVGVLLITPFYSAAWKLRGRDCSANVVGWRSQR